MPVYEYRCEEGHTFEAFQAMSEDALAHCQVCGSPASRVLSAPAIHYKGSGFYTTDYARKGAHKGAGSDGGDGGESKESKKADSSSESSSSGEKAGAAGAGSSSD